MSNTSPGNQKNQRSNSILRSLRGIFSREELSTNNVRNTTPRPITDKLLSECLQKLSKDTPVEKRLAFVEEFCEFITQYRLDRMFIGHLWNKIKDLLEPSQPQQLYHAGLKIIKALAEHHAERLGVVKAGKNYSRIKCQNFTKLIFFPLVKIIKRYFSNNWKTREY